MTKEEEVMNLRSGGTHKELEGEGNGVNTVLMHEILNKLKRWVFSHQLPKPIQSLSDILRS